MQSMIFAAGLGTRLKPLTDTKPKALVELNGKTLLEHTIETLRNAGTDSIVVNVHHFAEQINQFLSERDFGLPIKISDESDKLLDTGGGLRKAEQLFLKDEPILIHNVDIISNARLAEIYELGKLHDAVLLVSKRKTKRYLLFDEQMHLKGWTNIENKEVRSPYADLDISKCQMLAFSGIHVFSPRLFKKMQAFEDKFGIIDFYLKACADSDIVGYVQEDLSLTDIGKIEVLKQLSTT